MNREKCCKHAGYEQGVVDGKRTRGKINKRYLENLFESETQDLSEQESVLYKMGWQDGFVDAVRGTIKKTVRQEDCFEKHLDRFYETD